MVGFRRKRSTTAAPAASEGSIDHPLWQEVIALQAELDRLENDERTSVRAWNRLVDQHAAAIEAVASEPELVARAWDLALHEDSVESAAATRLLRDALAPALAVDDPTSLLTSPVLQVEREDLEVEAAVLIVEQRPLTSDDLELELDWEEDERRPSLSRLGGHPVVVAGLEPPKEDFLLQIDLTDLQPDWTGTDVAAVLTGRPELPVDGLLQVFARPDCDSSTAPGLPGGGVVLVRVPESDLVLSRRLAYPSGPADVPGVRLEFVGRQTVHARFESDDEVLVEKVQWLHETIGASVLADSDSSTNAIAPPSSRLFGLPFPDHDLEDEHREILDSTLPLVGPDDQHVLFLQVSSHGALEEAFGDSGVLEIWLRESDLRQADFDHVVSFLRSA